MDASEIVLFAIGAFVGLLTGVAIILLAYGSLLMLASGNGDEHDDDKTYIID